MRRSRAKKLDRLIRGTYRNEAAERWFIRFRNATDAYENVCFDYDELAQDHQCVTVITMGALKAAGVSCSCDGKNKDRECDFCEVKNYYDKSVKAHGVLHT